MKHCYCNLSELTIDIHEVYQTIGYRNCEPEKDIKRQIEDTLNEIRNICSPQYLYDIFPGELCDSVSIKIANQIFCPGHKIVSYLTDAESFCVFVTTAGVEFEKWKENLRTSGDLVKEFIADSIGSVIAESCVNHIQEELSSLQNINHTYPYSPGYCGWKLSEQQNLFSLLPDHPCSITLTNSCLMLPVKSISGIIGLGKDIKRKEYGCKICENINCYKRKEI